MIITQERLNLNRSPGSTPQMKSSLENEVVDDDLVGCLVDDLGDLVEVVLVRDVHGGVVGQIVVGHQLGHRLLHHGGQIHRGVFLLYLIVVQERLH